MFDTNDVMWCFMDQRRRRRKFFATTLLRALGYGSDEAILKLFYDFKTLETDKKWTEEGLRNLVMKEDKVDTDSQAVIARRYDPCTPAMMEQLAAAGIHSVEVVDVGVDNGTLIKTLREDAKIGIHNEEDALKDIYKRMRPGDPPTAQNAKQMMHKLFFELAHYDLGYVGRHKINKKLGLTGQPPAHLHGQGPGGRHRPSRQPPRAHDGRTAREPVPRGPGAHGPPDPRAHDAARQLEPGEAHPAAPRQLQDVLRARAGLLQPVPALAVHGPDEPALGPRAQAPSLGPRPRRPLPRPRGLRGARRASLALRPHLPDRDA